MMSEVTAQGGMRSKVARKGGRRMVRGSVVVLLAVSLMLFLAVHDRLVAQEEIITLQHTDIFKTLQRPAVRFPHDKHAAKYPDCLDCHHVYEEKGGQKVNVGGGEGQPCLECHKLEASGQRLSLRNAFHENCVGCHRTLERQSTRNGPVMCGECHIRGK